MNAGRLRHKIDIQVESTSKNDYGEPTHSWSNFISGLYCSIEPISGKEYFSSDITNNEVTHKLRIRYYIGLLPKMRVKYGTRYFYIVSILNFEERNKELLLMCKEAV